MWIGQRTHFFTLKHPWLQELLSWLPEVHFIIVEYEYCWKKSYGNACYVWPSQYFKSNQSGAKWKAKNLCASYVLNFQVEYAWHFVVYYYIDFLKIFNIFTTSQFPVLQTSFLSCYCCCLLPSTVNSRSKQVIQISLSNAKLNTVTYFKKRREFHQESSSVMVFKDHVEQASVEWNRCKLTCI